MNISALHMVAPTMTPLSTTVATPINSTNGTSSSSGLNLNASDAESTFLNMLVTELQNQDPTQPMDPEQMVGQMFSMNQLQQLIDINQTLQNIASASVSSAGTAAAAATQAVQGAH